MLIVNTTKFYFKFNITHISSNITYKNIKINLHGWYIHQL